MVSFNTFNGKYKEKHPKQRHTKKQVKTVKIFHRRIWLKLFKYNTRSVGHQSFSNTPLNQLVKHSNCMSTCGRRTYTLGKASVRAPNQMVINGQRKLLEWLPHSVMSTEDTTESIDDSGNGEDQLYNDWLIRSYPSKILKVHLGPLVGFGGWMITQLKN